MELPVFRSAPIKNSKAKNPQTVAATDNNVDSAW